MPAPLLSDCMRSRNNNLHLLRMVAASMVLVSHSFAITNGWPGGYEPWREVYGTTPGTVAVEIFFVVSGMLLTHSLLQRRSVSEFVRARVLRIYPGLAVAVALTVFVLGPWATTLDLASYFGDRSTWKHLLHNTLAIFRIEPALPGVFEDNPTRRVVNGSLWTLPLELRCYGLLLVAYLATAVTGKVRWFKVSCVVIFAASLALRVRELGTYPLEHGLSRLFLAFFSGSVLCIVGDRIRLHRGLFALGVAAIAAGAFVPTWLPWTYTVALPFVVVWLAYVPSHPMLRAYNRMGDYSYGTYIYAFPVQQALAFTMPGIRPVPMMVASGLATFAFAIASWHLVERPASRWRGRGSRAPGAVPTA